MSRFETYKNCYGISGKTKFGYISIEFFHSSSTLDLFSVFLRKFQWFSSTEQRNVI